MEEEPSSPIPVTRLAIFDFDGTILRGNSWHEFFRFELRRKPDRAPHLIAGYMLRRLRVWSGSRLRSYALGGLRGRSRAEVAEIGERLHRQRLARLVRDDALREIERRRDVGFQIVIATAGFDFVVSPFAAIARADALVASRVAFSGDCCLGAVLERETSGADKVGALLKAVASWGKIEWDESCAYTDSLDDLPLLESVGEPVLVTRKARLPRGMPTRTKIVDWK